MFYSDSDFFLLPNLYIVADGMGGHKSGEIASAKAIEYFVEFCASNSPEKGEILDFMVDAANHANKMVYELSCLDEHYSGMGTTFSACVSDGGKLYISHIGDSRIYLLTDSGIKQLTTDHTYVNEMVKAGQMTAEQAKRHHARNMLTRALGSERRASIDGYVAECAGAKAVLCSDGLSNMITDNEIFEICSQNKENNSEIAKLLTNAALENGGYDNCTVIVFDCAQKAVTV